MSDQAERSKFNLDQRNLFIVIVSISLCIFIENNVFDHSSLKYFLPKAIRKHF